MTTTEQVEKSLTSAVCCSTRLRLEGDIETAEAINHLVGAVHALLRRINVAAGEDK